MTPWVEATIVAVEHRTSRLVSVMLDAPLPGHRAGQHLDVQLTAPDGYAARRSYSIASAPGVRPFELLIERLDDGEVSPFFHEVAAAGDTLEVRGPLGGHFVWTESDGGPVLLAGGGSGVAPLLSILAARAAAKTPVPTLLVYSARGWDDLVDPAGLIDLERRDAGFCLTLVTTREQRRREHDLEHRLDAASLAGILTRWGCLPALSYVCGSNGFVETVASALVEAGVPALHIRTERYGSDSSIATA
ncbi:FAD-binding oxidoreductase [soil metagenome]